MTQAPKQDVQWIATSAVPPPFETGQFVLEPLAAEHVEVDYEALMSCRSRLREELQWRDWPPEGFTLEENREDLRRHHGEFMRGEGFAYTVLNPERTRCLGCIYLERCDEINGAQLAFWVIDDAIGLESELVANVVNWVHTAWSIDRVLIPFRATNTRGIALMRELGLTNLEIRRGPLADHRCFVSEMSEGEQAVVGDTSS